ncbi:hypothetical protein U1Q18_049009 [Sarracenia purpurea var. burkii]
MAYGFMDVYIDMKSSSMEHLRGSFYLFIPEIELNEFEGISMLAATLVWDDPSLRTFEEAIQSQEFVLYQVCINARCIGGRGLGNDAIELTELSSSCQFSVRLSPTLAIYNNMLDSIDDMRHSLQNYPNINTLWACLIIEECFRLGLTYFCVAPGSRSSALAIAASTHPHTTCISCFDERSLAFHAVGFGRGSHKPAVVITSSGTAVSNLLPAVVEASQGFVPLILLTADRPPELKDAGANQSINQVE